jgi:hypothetical protein
MQTDCHQVAKTSALTDKNFPTGRMSNRCQFVFCGIVEKNQTIQRPTVTQIGQNAANIQISFLDRKITFLVPMIAFQNHDDNTANEFQQDALQDTEFAFDKKGTCPMDAFEGAMMIMRGGGLIMIRCHRHCITFRHTCRQW